MTSIPSDTATLLAPAARVEHATKRFGEGSTAVCALDDVTLAIPRAASPRSCGRVRLRQVDPVHCMAGLDTLTSGRTFIGDRDLAELDDRDLTVLRRERIGFVFQAFNLLPH